jgi:ribosome recycling factor
MAEDKTLVEQVMKAVRKSANPLKPVEVEKRVRVKAKTARTDAVRETIRSLVDRGDLQVTLDWRLRAGK